MPRDTRTRKMIRPSFLCRRVSVSCPESWEELSQDDLLYVFRMLRQFGPYPDWQERVQTACFFHFTNISVDKRTPDGWLCRRRDSGDTFLLDPSDLPALCGVLSWTCDTSGVSVRIAKAGRYEAVDYELRELMFGDYLLAENYYQAFMQTKDEHHLQSLAFILYGVEDTEEGLRLFADEMLTGTFLWFTSVKQVLGRWFPNFLKPASADSPPTRESQHESIRNQIRLLTKGDVTKQKYILEQTDTWTALGELDALAKEAEEISKKYGK